LYEMTTGKRTFQGETAAETMTAILKQDPPGMAEVNQQVSPGLERLVRHCLGERPEGGFQSASDLAFALEALSGIGGESVVTGLKQPDSLAWHKRRERWAWIAATVFLIGLLASLPFTLAYLRQAPAEARVIRFSIPAPEKANLGSIAISPDGR